MYFDYDSEEDTDYSSNKNYKRKRYDIDNIDDISETLMLPSLPNKRRMITNGVGDDDSWSYGKGVKKSNIKNNNKKANKKSLFHMIQFLNMTMTIPFKKIHTKKLKIKLKQPTQCKRY